MQNPQGLQLRDRTAEEKQKVTTDTRLRWHKFRRLPGLKKGKFGHRGTHKKKLRWKQVTGTLIFIIGRKEYGIILA